MVLNFTLSDRVDIAPSDGLSRNRTWYGWDPGVDLETLWEVNRGDWAIGKRALEQRYATLSYEGRVVLVAAITGRESVKSDKVAKWALKGYVLPSDHAAHRALHGRAMPRRRQPVAYVEDMPEVDAIPLAASPPDVRLPRPGRPAVIATWSPKGGGFTGAPTFEEAIEATQGGDNIVRDRWSVGRRTKGIDVGDRMYLLRTGDEAGIVASGWVASTPYAAPHWDPAHGGTTQYVDLDWDFVVPLDERLTREDLRTLVSGAVNDWAPMGGGAGLEPAEAEALAHAWMLHVGDKRAGATLRGEPRAARGGQGHQMDPVRRKKIEDAAQTRLEEHFRAQGFTVEDVRFKEHFDALATRDQETYYLEAKGTTTDGAPVIVTRAEVDWARTHRGQVVMGVWANMAFTADGEIDRDAGEFSVFDYDPDKGRLAPRSYDWFVES
ncbi:protein NO VEIN domain-containing protein [Nocardioides jishulii]|uniref:Protein NO VEIN C-terminal domain-containing protein n=1 Tax=Nocardioides jishulii TaxID=2575440 RepID=A0A4U2YPG3_9ACTN|nr:DUF3883 domain-containing protein [Nocardioides jishulii]TKI62522.1 hypothetical protein FC770_09065 [Nocardioides jishulii]